MENRTTELNINAGTDNSAAHASTIADLLAKVKASARVKQRSVENLIESAQATQGKVLQRFNDHIDQLELEKARLKQETNHYKAISDKISDQFAGLEAELEKLKLEKKNQTAELNQAKNDFEQKLNLLSQDNNQLNHRIFILEEEKKDQLKKNSELAQYVQTLQVDIDRLKKEIADTNAEFTASKTDAAERQQELLAEKSDLEAKIQSLMVDLEASKAESTRRIASLSDDLERAEAKASEAENERKKAEAKLIKFQQAWDKLEG